MIYVFAGREGRYRPREASLAPGPSHRFSSSCQTGAQPGPAPRRTARRAAVGGGSGRSSTVGAGRAHRCGGGGTDGGGPRGRAGRRRGRRAVQGRCPAPWPGRGVRSPVRHPGQHRRLPPAGGHRPGRVARRGATPGAGRRGSLGAALRHAFVDRWQPRGHPSGSPGRSPRLRPGRGWSSRRATRPGTSVSGTPPRR